VIITVALSLRRFSFEEGFSLLLGLSLQSPGFSTCRDIRGDFDVNIGILETFAAPLDRFLEWWAFWI